MHIRQLKIERFKSFASVEFHFNADLNVLTGVNNSGKTTVLEAIALWAECFRRRLWRAERADRKHRVQKGQYRLDYEAYMEVDSVRSPNFADIFHDLTTDSPILLQAVLAGDGADLTIGFTIRSAHGGNYAVNLRDSAHYPFAAFNDFFQGFPEPIHVVYASPVAALLPRETFETLPKIKAQVSTRQSMVVLRNRLYQLKKNSVLYQAFVDSVSQVLSEGREPVAFFFHGDETRDVEIPVRVQVGPKDVAKDISLLGSGTLQIIEIMLAVHAEQQDLNIILLDEPDSHIHRDIQRRLIKKLTEHADRTQVFLTTHNESLIRSTSPGHLFHLEARGTKTYHPVYEDKSIGQRRGLQPSRQLKILQTLGSETSIDFLNALESERLVLVEGEDDARFIQAIVERATSPVTPFFAMYWSFDGIENIFQRIGAYREIFQQFKNDRTLWDRAVLVIDRDHLTDQRRADLLRELPAKLGNIPVYISTSYTMEATVLSEPGKLKMLLAQLILKEENVSVPPAEIERLVDAGLAALTTKLQQRAGDQHHLQGLFHRMRTRRERLDALGIKVNIIHEDGSLQPEYIAYTSLALAQGKVHLLANKDDVAEFIERVYRGLSRPFQPDKLFERLIEAATPSTWFDEWKDLRQAVR
jgi:predicted ATPase